MYNIGKFVFCIIVYKLLICVVLFIFVMIKLLIGIFVSFGKIVIIFVFFILEENVKYVKFG